MSDLYQTEVNPDQEPGELLQEGLQGADPNAEPEDEDADPDL